MAFPIGIQVYSVRGEAKADLLGTLTQIKEMGYDGVEFAGLYDYAPEEIRDMCAKLGLVPISAHVPYLTLIADPEGTLAMYKTIGCKYVAVPYLTEEYRPGTDKFPGVIEGIKKIGAVAKDMGIQLLYHNHDFEFATIDGKYALDMIYDETTPDILKTELDVCWVNVGGEVPASYIKKYSGRSPVVHLKDFYGEKSEDMYELIGLEAKTPARPGNFEFRPVGSGIQNFPEILKASEESGATWVVVEQDKATMGLTPLESIQKSREYLRTLGY